MNYDVWLMLLGFNVDYWEQKDIEKAISDFGKLLVWEEDPIHLARIIVKARVVDLTEIPWFLVCSEGEDFEGDSWTAQCEILQVRQLGGGPLGEDEPPNRPNGVQPTMFEFFGFGQPVKAQTKKVVIHLITPKLILTSMKLLQTSLWRVKMHKVGDYGPIRTINLCKFRMLISSMLQ